MSDSNDLFSRKSLVGLAVITLLLGAVGASQQLAASAPQDRRAKLPRTLTETQPWSQVSRDIRKALQRNHDATSSAQWRASGYLPEDLFENLRALQEPEAWKSLCRNLGELSAEELTLFESAIEANQREPAFSCADELQAKLSRHWDEVRDRLDAREPSIAKLPLIERTSGTPLENREVALVLAGGPHPARTEKVLSILRQHGARAHFFQVGRNVRANPDLARLILDRGHEVGSHTFHLRTLPRLDLRSAQEEILAGQRSVSGATGREIPAFLFPVGESTPHLVEFVRERRMTVVEPTVDSHDWQIRDPQQLAKRVLYALDRDGKGVLLLNESREQSVIALPMILAGLASRGFSVVVFSLGSN